MKIIMLLLFVLAMFSVAFSASTDIDDINTAVKIWTEVQEYINTHDFYYGVGTNQHHADYVADNILYKYGVTETEDYFIGVLGTPDYRPEVLIVVFELNGLQYKRVFKIKNVVKESCDDPGRCV